MNGIAGFSRLIRLILRQERVRLTAWLVALGVIPPFTAQAFLELYPTEASRQALAATIGGNPAFTAFLGPLQGTSIGALTAWRLLVINAALVGIMAVLTMVRHTRLEEETGRRELLGSTVVGRHAPLLAAVVVAVGAGAAIGAIQAAGLIAVGLETSGSLAFGVGSAATALLFTGVAALAAQLTSSAGGARGIGLAALGALFLLRIAGDSAGVEALGWATPFGWLIELAPYAGQTWWVVVLWAGGFAGFGVVAVALSGHRDVGAGVFPPRAGRRRAGPALSGPHGLAWRLQRNGLVGWTLGVATIGLVYGGLADSVGDLLEGNPQMRQLFELMGGERGLIDGFFTAAIGIIALIVSAYAIRTVLRLGDEEAALRLEYVLATATPRASVAWSHVAVAMAGSALMLLLAGAVAGAAYGSTKGDVLASAGRVVATAAVQIPAVWVMAGLATTLFGRLPRRVGLSWAALVAFLFLGQLGPILRLPQWAMNLSPFTHVSGYPVEALDPVPLASLVVVAAALVVVGMVALRVRDVPAV